MYDIDENSALYRNTLYFVKQCLTKVTQDDT